MSEATRSRRAVRGNCADCGAEIGAKARRCKTCARKHANELQAERDKRIKAKLCPRCGKRCPDPTAKSCFECGFDWKDGDCMVDAIVTHDRLWQKKLKGD